MNKLMCLAAVIVSGCVLRPLAAAQTFDAAAEFSPTANPTAVWSYGYTTTLGGSFNLYTENGKYPNPDESLTELDYWGENIQFHDPAVMHNGTGVTQNLDTVTYQPGQLAAHPGPNGEYSVIRFTAPVAGTYSLQATFTGIDFEFPTTTDVHVLVGGISVFDGEVTAFGSGPSYTADALLAIGEVVDFTIGYGSNGNFIGDSTGVAAVMVIPEPSTYFMAAMGIVVLLFARRRKR
jgi:hypothetical protein